MTPSRPRARTLPVLIEGYADRRPKIPGNPTAAANRRIQILVRNVKP